MKLAFHSRLERLAPGVNYFAFSVPLKISRALKTRGPVPVSARVNDSESFLISLYPVGGGRHYLRVKAKIRNSVNLKEGERALVQITVLDLSLEAELPKDLERALRAEGVLKQFKALPPGKRRYALRRIDEAGKPETREKRIREIVDHVIEREKR